MPKQQTWTIETEQGRLDKIIVEKTENVTRSQIQQWFKKSAILVNGQNVKANYKVAKGDVVTLTIPEPEVLTLTPENIPLDIVYEDDDVIVVNKPQGMVVHPAAGHPNGTLVNALLYHSDLGPINDTIRPGIVHRIDKDTSGLLMVAKNQNAQNSLMSQLKAKTSKREYLALVHGVFDVKKGIIEAPIGRSKTDRKKQAVVEGGKPAVTHFEVLESFPHMNYSLVKCVLETGRTHQIRVHMQFIKHPVAGDPIYGPRKTLAGNGQYLHAALLGFTQPTSGKYLEFNVPLPAKFQKTLTDLEAAEKSLDKQADSSLNLH